MRRATSGNAEGGCDDGRAVYIVEQLRCDFERIRAGRHHQARGQSPTRVTPH
jgi:hypothetical protein